MGLHGGDVWNLRESHGRGPDEILDFSSNINPLGVPPTVRRLLADQPDLALRYPDPDYRDLRQGLGQWLGLPADQVAVGNGASELIREVLLVLKPRRVMVPVPGFAEYSRAAAHLGIEVMGHRLEADRGFALDAQRFQADLDAHHPEVVFWCNPNNPTGQQLDGSSLGAMAQACRAAGAWLVVDETFIELSRLGEGASAVPLVSSSQGDRLVVLRAFTKVFALPGLRLGYLATSPGFAARVRASLVPWSVNGFAAQLGHLCHEETAYLAETRRWMAHEPDWFYDQLMALAQDSGSPLESFWRPDVNFLLGRLRPGNTAANLRQVLLDQGILIRDCGNFAGLSAQYFRVAVKSRHANQRLVEALSKLAKLRL